MAGDELRRRREALGLTQPQLAEKLGVHRNTVWRWERRGVPRLMVTYAGDVLARLERHVCAKHQDQPLSGEQEPPS